MLTYFKSNFRLSVIIFLLVFLLPACTSLRTVPIDYQPLLRPENFNKEPVDLKVAVRFRSTLQHESVAFSIGNERFVVKLGEILGTALEEATQLVFQPSAPAAALPPEAFLEFQLVTAVVDAPRTILGAVSAVHDVNYRIEIKAFLSDPRGKEIWRGAFSDRKNSRVLTLINLWPEKNIGENLSESFRKIANDFVKEVLSKPEVAEYVKNAQAARRLAKAPGVSEITGLGFALQPGLSPPHKIGVVDLRPVEQASALAAYDLSSYLRKELSSWGLSVFDPENTRHSLPQVYAQYWACDNLHCLTDAGRKMGYDFMIYGSVMEFQKRYVLTLRLLTTDPTRDPQLKVVSSEGNFKEDELPAALKKLVESLLAAE